MKKILLYSILVCIILILIKYGYSNYKIDYKVDGFEIHETFKENRF